MITINELSPAVKTNPAHPPGASHDTRTKFPSGMSIEELIEEQVQRTPQATAIVCENTRLTYAELNARADELAGQLRESGIGPDVPVGLCVERSAEMMIALLAILKAGGCYVPLDPTYPTERLAFMLSDAQPPVLLTQTSLLDHVPFQNPETKRFCVDQIPARPVSLTQKIPARESSRLAYVIYTSGSTGKPKGVMITHRNVVNFFTAMDQILGVEPGVWLAVTSISFDISVLELLWTLTHGFTVVLCPEAARATESSIPEQIFHHGVTHLQCTPSLAGTFIRSPDSATALRRLRKLLIGGEALPATLASKIRPMLSGEFFNLYGPTETTVWSAVHPIQEEIGTVPIGRPVANTQIHILDERLQPVIDGEAGEIFIGGEGVARGYFNRPGLTAEKFIPDPFVVPASRVSESGPGRTDEPEPRLYRTGDVGRYRADGEIEFLGRVDHQIKLRGHRIELGEIESALRRHAAVRECVVHAWEPEPGDKRLAAYVVPLSASEALAVELRRFLEAALPGYMIPAAFVWLEQMPLTPNGKIDRNALPPPREHRPKLDTAYFPPQTEIEDVIAAVWKQVLRVEKTGVQDNFFDLGGDSLLLMETHTKLCLALKTDIPIIRFFEHPTIAALASFIAGREKSPLPTARDRALRQRHAFGPRQEARP